MNFAPYQWRANQGYLPPLGSVPMPVTAPAIYPYLYPYPQQPVAYGHQIAYGLGQFEFVAAQPALSKKKDDDDKKPPPAPLAAPAKKEDDKKAKPAVHFLPVTAPVVEKKEPPSDDTKSSHSLATAHYAAPCLRPGMKYMYASTSSHTILHVFSKAAPIWEEKYTGQNLGFKIFKVAMGMSVGTVVERVMGRESGDEACKEWAVTEVVEGGDGGWIKGTTIPYGSDKAKGTLGSMGWNAKRGDSLPPVWIVVHKA